MRYSPCFQRAHSLMERQMYYWANIKQGGILLASVKLQGILLEYQERTSKAVWCVIGIAGRLSEKGGSCVGAQNRGYSIPGKI